HGDRSLYATGCRAVATRPLKFTHPAARCKQGDQMATSRPPDGAYRIRIDSVCRGAGPHPTNGRLHIIDGCGELRFARRSVFNGCRNEAFLGELARDESEGSLIAGAPTATTDDDDAWHRASVVRSWRQVEIEFKFPCPIFGVKDVRDNSN